VAQGIKNRELGEVFVDEKNKQILYTLTKIETYQGNGLDEVLSLVAADTGDDYKIANRVEVKNKDRIKGAALVQLTRKRTGSVYNLIRLYSRPIAAKTDIPVWAGKGLKDDFQRVYGIQPRLRSAIVGQSAYQPSKFDFSKLMAASATEAADNKYHTPTDLLNALIEAAKADRTKLGAVVLRALQSLKNGFGTVIPGGEAFKKEVNIYASEFIVPLAIAMNKTDVAIDNPVVKINTQSNSIGYDAVVKDSKGTEFLISVKQGGTRKSYGAYGSVAFLKKIVDEKRDSLARRIPNLDLYEKLLNILLGSAVEQGSEQDNYLAGEFSRKTYRNLFAVARKLEVPQSEIDSVYASLISKEATKEEKINLLNKFALKVYDALNQTAWFKDATKTILDYVNFLQAKLAMATTKEGGLVILGVQVDTTKNKTIDFSARKSYFSNKLASGHGGFLLKEILAEEPILGS
jgi:hypothetical protein